MNQYIGRLLDNRYEILEVIGTGGMAVVYKARCHRLNRLVAVKILKDEYSGDEEFRRRFRAEGEAVAMLSHPNIVQVFDVSSNENANYIVMELIDGISLKHYMEVKGVLNWKETLHFAMQIAKGLEHAHSRGIIHRDIKPHNVMVLKNGSIKVMDFGIARVMNKSNTLTKEALGSVHYISPEQAKGSLTDNRSDLYSLSVVMYEMMTGRPPFDGDSPVAVAIKHINGGAPAPSLLNPNIPRALEQIIVKGMSLEPKDRYSSATEMLTDMEEFRKNPQIVFDYVSPIDDVTRAIPGGLSSTGNGAAEGQTRKLPVSGRIRTAEQEARQKKDRERSEEALRRAQRRRREEEERRNERSGVATAAVVACSIVAIIAIIVFLVAVFNGALLNQERELVDVPYLEGAEYSESLSTQYPNLTIRLMPQQYNTTYRKGLIMHQEPAGGEKVSKGTELHITVSMGEEPQVKVMEYLVGVAQEEARAFLMGQGFVPLVRNESSDIYEIGQVIRTEPMAGTELADGQTVKLWVSTGRKVVMTKMPDVMGLAEDTAIQVLRELGFTNVTIQHSESNAPIGEVIYQSEQKRTEIDVNTEIILEVSDGPAATVPATEKPAEAEKPTEKQTEATENPALQTELPAATEPAARTVYITLPIRQEKYQLIVLHNGNKIVGPVEIAPGSNSYPITMEAKGSASFDIYINDEFYQTQGVNFG